MKRFILYTGLMTSLIGYSLTDVDDITFCKNLAIITLGYLMIKLGYLMINMIMDNKSEQE
jgi:hypothetical protein